MTRVVMRQEETPDATREVLVASARLLTPHLLIRAFITDS